MTLMLYDPTNAQQKAGIRGWGTQGITGRISARIPAKIGNFAGYPHFYLRDIKSDRIELGRHSPTFLTP